MTNNREKEIFDIILDESIKDAEKQLRNGPSYEQFTAFIQVIGKPDYPFEEYKKLNKEASELSLRDYKIYKSPSVSIHDVNYARLLELRLVLPEPDFELPGVTNSERQHFINIVGNMMVMAANSSHISQVPVSVN